MKEGLEFARVATDEKREMVKRKVLSEVSHDPSNPPPAICPPITNGVDGTDAAPVNGVTVTDMTPVDASATPITNGAGSSISSVVGKQQRQFSGKRAPDPDSTTNGRKESRDWNLNDAVRDEDSADAMDFIGEDKSTQPFTGIKAPSKMTTFLVAV